MNKSPHQNVMLPSYDKLGARKNTPVTTGVLDYFPAALAEVARVSQPRPEFFRLPKSGVDPYFGLGRSYYYEGEKQGFWKLTRIRQRGKLRGITLVPYDAVAAFIRKQEVAK